VNNREQTESERKCFVRLQLEKKFKDFTSSSSSLRSSSSVGQCGAGRIGLLGKVEGEAEDLEGDLGAFGTGETGVARGREELEVEGCRSEEVGAIAT